MDLTLPLLIFFLLNNTNDPCDDTCGCENNNDKMTLAMCLCLLCLS